MEAATVVEQETEQPDEGAPVNGAEATRSATHLFQYSRYVHLGEGAEECEHREDGECEEAGHFHAWICLPNALQRQDIIDKAKAARARRRRALSEEGSDPWVMLEAELDELLEGDREALLKDLAEREASKGAMDRVRDLIENDERFENYWQDAEEWTRLQALPEDERPQDEWEPLDRLITDFEDTLQRQNDETVERETEHLKSLGEDQLRKTIREIRAKGEGREAHERAYYLWMGFISTKASHQPPIRRYFDKLEDYRNASPEAIAAIEATLTDLEGRQQRGDAAGN